MSSPAIPPAVRKALFIVRKRPSRSTSARPIGRMSSRACNWSNRPGCRPRRGRTAERCRRSASSGVDRDMDRAQRPRRLPFGQQADGAIVADLDQVGEAAPCGFVAAREARSANSGWRPAAMPSSSTSAAITPAGAKPLAGAADSHFAAPAAGRPATSRGKRHSSRSPLSADALDRPRRCRSRSDAVARPRHRASRSRAIDERLGGRPHPGPSSSGGTRAEAAPIGAVDDHQRAIRRGSARRGRRQVERAADQRKVGDDSGLDAAGARRRSTHEGGDQHRHDSRRRTIRQRSARRRGRTAAPPLAAAARRALGTSQRSPPSSGSESSEGSCWWSTPYQIRTRLAGAR